jgi:hypothetical protein
MCRNASHNLRTEACDLAPVDWVRAIALADQIEDPWYACQAYAWCGRFAPSAQSGALLEEALRRARAGKDAYQQLAAAAWPLRALMELGHHQRAATVFESVADLAMDVEPQSSRAEACYLVFQSVAFGPRELATNALHWLLTALQPGGHWRERRAVREAVIEAMTVGLIQQSDVPALIRDDRLTAQVLRRIANGDRRQPRSFFWPRGQPAGT